MYVGYSANGIRRLAGHHVLPTDYTDADYVEMYPCGSRLEALNLECEMIAKLKPALNMAKPKRVTPEILLRRPLRRKRT